MTHAADAIPVALYLGLMSGTSADGIDAALVRFDGEGRTLRCELVHARTFGWDAALRAHLVALGSDTLPGLVVGRTHATHVLGMAVPQRGERQPPRRAQQQLRAQRLLQLGHLPADVRLGAAKRGRRGGEAAVLGDRGEAEHPVDVGGHCFHAETVFPRPAG